MEQTESTTSRPAHELDKEQQHQWDENHKIIMECIHDYMRRHDGVPTLRYIAEQTGLNRKTISKHLNGFMQMPDFKEHTGIYKMMASNVLGHLYSLAMLGEVKAARLYMQLIGIINNNTIVENNFLTGRQDTLML